MIKNPRRIYKILKLVTKAWTASPDLRLAQLLFAAVEQSPYNGDPFYCEDDELAKGLNVMIAQREAK